MWFGTFCFVVVEIGNFTKLNILFKDGIFSVVVEKITVKISKVNQVEIVFSGKLFEFCTVDRWGFCLWTRFFKNKFDYSVLVLLFTLEIYLFSISKIKGIS